MRHSSAGIGAVAVGIAIAVTGCAGEDTAGAPASGPGSGAATETSAPGGRPSADPQSVRWMGKLCGELGKLAGLAHVNPPDVKPGDVKGEHKALTGVVDKLKSRIGSLVDGLEELPDAPQAAGDEVRKKLPGMFRPIEKQLGTVADELAAADPGDKQAIVDAVTGLDPVLSSLQNLDNPLQRLKGTELLAAGQQAPACRKLGGSPAGPAATPTS